MSGRFGAVRRYRDFSLLCGAFLSMGLASQMAIVAIGWQVYGIHRHALDLGLVGLCEFIPLPLLALPAGQLADRVSRRLIFMASVGINTIVMALLLVVSLSGGKALWAFLLLAFGNGIAGGLGRPAVRALPPALVPPEVLPRAMALLSSTFQIAWIGGPALGGGLLAIRASLVYAVGVGLLVVGLFCMALLHERGVAVRTSPAETVGLESVLAGVRFLRRTPLVLGAILLDLFAVLFGGAVALLPLFARTILHVGPLGLGILRSAPAVGALAAGLWLARRPLGSRTGRTLLIVVALFGASIIVFGLSKSIVLSCAALAVSGAVDMVSMNIRSTTVALATPDELRGRVSAVEMVFISASNELGAFESGLAAALLGAVPAVVAGGAITIALAGAWFFLFPTLARVDRLEHIRPRAAAADEPAV